MSKHWPECVAPAEVGDRGSCICDGKGLATPVVAGNYESFCHGCNRRMLNSDKRCGVCTDCVRPAPQHREPHAD